MNSPADHHPSPLIRKDYIGRASIAAAALFLPNLRVFITLILLATAYAADLRAAVALGGSIAGLVTVLASGFIPTTVRSVSIAYKKSGGMSAVPGAVMKELRPAFGAALLLTVVGILALVVSFSLPGTSRLFAIYLGFTLAFIALSPVSFVLNGAFQALNRDGKNLTAAVVGVCVQLAIAVTVVLIRPPQEIAVAILGLGVSLSALIGFSFRAAQLHHLGALPRHALATSLTYALRNPLQAPRGLMERAAASIDGLVFIAFFTVAIMVAAAHSPESGAAVGLTVTFMRATIVPLKQFGMVGGRFVLKEQGNPGAITLIAVQCSSALILAIVAALLIAGRLFTPALDEIPWLVIALMVIQLTLEPWGSVLYSYAKVAHSAYKGLPALITAYVALGLPGLALLGALGNATPLAVWIILLSTRLIFVAMQVAGLFFKDRRRGIAGAVLT